MTSQRQSGFTIVEVVLFLAVTGALAVAILVGSTSVINQQRYRDSVNTLKGLIQEQYGQVANVVNSEERNPSCSPVGATLSMNEENQQARGTSECLVTGRFMLVEPTTVTVFNLIGQPPLTTEETSDSAVLGEYAMAVQSPGVYEVSWGARVVRPGTVEGMTTAVLVIRSPLSGAILTYIQDVPSGTTAQDQSQLGIIIGGMINDANMVQKDFCLDSDGMLSRGNRMAVRIAARASSQSAVEVPLESDGVCD